MNSKFRIAILLVIVAAEIAILFALRNVGWEASVAKLSWLGSVAIASLPLLAIFVILFRGRHRISLSSLLITVALVAIFLAAVITPIQSAKRLRLGSIALTEIGGGIVTTSSYPNLNTERVNPLPVWLRPLSSDTIACPCDADILGIMLTNDLEIKRYCAYAQNFLNLREIQLIGPNITNDGLEQLRSVSQHSDKLESLIVGDVQFDETLLDQMPRLTHLWLYQQRSYYKRSSSRSLTAQHISAIARLKQLNGLTIQGYDTGDQNITQFGESKSLAQINFVNSIVSGASVDALDSAMPNCVVCRPPTRRHYYVQRPLVSGAFARD